MEIKEFAEIIREKMEERTGLEVRLQAVPKNNGVVFHGLNIMNPGCNVIPTIYLEHYLGAYESGIALDVILNHIEETASSNNRPNNLNMDWFRDWEKVKGKVGYRLINYEANKELLKDIPHEKFLDLAKVYYVVVEDSGFGGGSILIHNSHLGFWGVTAEQLEKVATANTAKLFPVEFINMWETLEELKPSDCDLSELDFAERSMYIASNTKKINGAAVLCYPNAIGEFAEWLGSDLYILPSSIHELLLVLPCEDVDKEHLKDMVHEVNQTMVAAEEILSDSVYYYSRETKAITIA